ncbi:DUF3576 domain-containing protein [Salipiger sp. IMCC34102]|uniref:DUF3576 domain-containing protein n=1 Tax=Salipiger sp. IMCC34102 TaxID=2510647 RepID=UPI00101CC8B3|nr:DUF3576 domain-containing protein [Salipiger sp. IMCC34102]RYH04033.1 DUF3576 domain-containing protein [Salipiger sp. IMCC34102]
MTQAFRLGRLALIGALVVGVSGCGLFRTGPTPVVQDTGPNPILYQASLDTLSFLPLQGADATMGRIDYGLARAPGGTTPYQVSVRVTSPVLDARSLSVLARTAGGASAPGVQAGLRDAILTRARQIRIAAAQP